MTFRLQFDKLTDVDKNATQHLVGKESQSMVNTQLLDEAIAESGKSKSFLADKCGMSVQTLRLKRLNVSPFTTDEVETLCNELSIKPLSKKERIFFAKNVDKVST